MKSFFALLITLVMGEMAQAQDWANLNRYKVDNAQLGLPASGVRRVVFMGNSITELWKIASPDFFARKPYIDRGISGQTSPQMLIRFRADVIDLKPAVVLILAGINDIAENTGPTTLKMIEDNIVSMAELAKANGIKAILCSVLPAIDFPWRPGLQPVEKIISLNKMIKEYADKNGLMYVDYYSRMVDSRKALKAEYTEDGVHPNRVGYKVMEPLAEAAITSLLFNK